MSGFAIQPAGTSPYGVGTPAVAPFAGGSVLRDPNSNSQLAGRLIDPGTKQYVFDSYGRPLGMTETKQLVQLAVSTNKGSSAVQTLGNELFKVATITNNFVRRVTDVYSDALQDVVSRGLIQINSIDVQQVAGSRAYVVIKWTDLSAGVEESLTI